MTCMTATKAVRTPTASPQWKILGLSRSAKLKYQQKSRLRRKEMVLIGRAIFENRTMSFEGNGNYPPRAAMSRPFSGAPADQRRLAANRSAARRERGGNLRAK